MSEQERDKMDVLREALKAGLRVEIRRNIGMGSSTYSVAAKSSRDAAEANNRGERVTCLFHEQGDVDEYGADANEVRELLALGAVEV